MGKRQTGVKSDVLSMGTMTLAALLADLGGKDAELKAKTFKSGKVGFGLNGTVSLRVGGKKGPVKKFAAGVNAVAINTDPSPLPEKARLEIERMAEAGESIPLKALNLDTVQCSPREFSTRKVGFYFGDKVTVKVGGELVKLQIGAPVTAWHSDSWAVDHDEQQEEQQQQEEQTGDSTSA